MDIGNIPQYAPYAYAGDTKSSASAVVLVQMLDSTGEIGLINFSGSITNTIGNVTASISNIPTVSASIFNSTGLTASISNIPNVSASLIGTQIANTLLTTSSYVFPVQTVGAITSSTLLNNVSNTGNSSSFDLSLYKYFTVQNIISGTVTAGISSSLNGTNWNTETSNTGSYVFRLTGKTKYIAVTYGSGSGTLTSILMAGN